VWVDRSEQLIRYLEVSTGSGFADRSVLLPMQMCIVDGGARAVKVRAITSAQFGQVPETASTEQITLLEEEKIVGYYGGGHLYATRDRQEPWL
jgi:photosynthetic reaction center H subunit